MLATIDFEITIHHGEHVTRQKCCIEDDSKYTVEELVKKMAGLLAQCYLAAALKELFD